MEPPEALVRAPCLRIRGEYFGGLAWRTGPRRIYRLDPVATAALLLHDRPRPLGGPAPAVTRLGLAGEDWPRVVADLRRQELLVPTPAMATAVTWQEAAQVRQAIDHGMPRHPVLKPLWAHLQPFTRCNQHCIHCYCHGGATGDPFLLPVETWLGIVGRLDEYGILDVYVTGGESLLYDGFFVVAEEILSRGMGFGLSTNATVLSGRVLGRLKDLALESVQVSLDGAHAAIHERIRGTPGSFRRALDGITRIAAFSQPVINTVVNRLNLGELEDLVKLGREHGCTRFKFFPQKPVGRSGSALTLGDSEIMHRLVPECARLAAAYDVEIDTLDPGRPCGSGSVGFALDQRGDIYPCIFGVADSAQRCGNILADSLDTVWFGSPALVRFREEVTTPCRRCEG